MKEVFEELRKLIDSVGGLVDHLGAVFNIKPSAHGVLAGALVMDFLGFVVMAGLIGYALTQSRPRISSTQLLLHPATHPPTSPQRPEVLVRYDQPNRLYVAAATSALWLGAYMLASLIGAPIALSHTLARLGQM